MKVSINSGFTGRLLRLPPKQIFLIDAIGALCTSTGLFLIYRFLSPAFGLDPSIFIKLALLVCFYFLYSVSVYLSRPTRWPRLLIIIASANAAYPFIALCILIIHHRSATPLAYIYFVLEAFLLFALALLEWKYFTMNRNRTFG